MRRFELSYPIKMNYEHLRKGFETAEAKYRKENTEKSLAEFEKHALKLIKLHQGEIHTAQARRAEAREQNDDAGQKKASETEELARERLADVRGRYMGFASAHGIKGESFDLELARKTAKKPKPPEKIGRGWKGYIPRIRQGKTRLG